MKGKIIVKDEKWYVEIQSDLHGYGIGWGDSKVYPLLITDENIWAGKEVEVEPVHYDSNFIPVIVKIKEVVETAVVNTMPKNEEGKPFVNTMPMIETNKPMKLYTEEQLQEAYNRGHMDGKLNNTDYSITDGFKPIELPSDDDMANASNHCKDGQVKVGFLRGVLWLKEQLLNQNK